MTIEHPVSDLRREVRFTIDGQPFTTGDRRQPARDLLALAGLDPTVFDLGEVRGASPGTRRFGDDEVVKIRPGAKFVSIRECADVA
ncbi:MAG: hypothetical protein GY798_25380 [Hyphomicrobiales bacterium]|nr:hypothetical protein [Hyphomicrobiales bacterium]